MLWWNSSSRTIRHRCEKYVAENRAKLNCIWPDIVSNEQLFFSKRSTSVALSSGREPQFSTLLWNIFSFNNVLCHVGLTYSELHMCHWCYMEMENVINLPMYSQLVFLNFYLFVYLSLQFYIHKLILILFYLPIFYLYYYVKIRFFQNRQNYRRNMENYRSSCSDQNR